MSNNNANTQNSNITKHLCLQTLINHKILQQTNAYLVIFHIHNQNNKLKYQQFPAYIHCYFQKKKEKKH